MIRRLASVGLVCAGLARAGVAGASEGYPEAVAAEVNAAAPPPCSTCHASGDSGSWSTLTLFGEALWARGLRGGDPSTVGPAIERALADRVDSDGDGAFDADEVSWGGDPNVADVPAGAPEPTPAYGCTVASAADTGHLTTAAHVGLVIAALLRRRRRPAR